MGKCDCGQIARPEKKGALGHVERSVRSSVARFRFMSVRAEKKVAEIVKKKKLLIFLCASTQRPCVFLFGFSFYPLQKGQEKERKKGGNGVHNHYLVASYLYFYGSKQSDL